MRKDLEELGELTGKTVNSFQIYIQRTSTQQQHSQPPSAAVRIFIFHTLAQMLCKPYCSTLPHMAQLLSKPTEELRAVFLI